MKSLIEILEETLDRSLESFLDNADQIHQEEVASQEPFKYETKHE